jgi:hypothetical protein
MALGNGNPKQGDKGSNWSYEFKSLTQLKNIKDAIDELIVLTGTDQDYEAKLVIDQDGAGETWLEVRIWNPDTQTWETPEYARPGDNTFYQLGDPGGPIAPLVYINPNTFLAQIVSNTTDLATETTLTTVVADLALIYTNLQLNTISVANIDTKLTAAARTPNIGTYVNVTGAVASGLYSFSIANVGSAAGEVDGQVLPAGVTINFDAGALNNTLGGLSFDASGTTFVVTWIS